MAPSNNELEVFLENGHLNPNAGNGFRLRQATALIGQFFQCLKKLEAVPFDEDCNETMAFAVERWKTCGEAFAQELVTPLEDVFFQQVFSHKFLRDILRVLMFFVLSVKW